MILFFSQTFQDSTKSQTVSGSNTEAEVSNITGDADEEDKSPKFPMPDTSQMLPFKPKFGAGPDAHPIPGGIFPPPPAAAELMLRMPPPFCFSVS